MQSEAQSETQAQPQPQPAPCHLLQLPLEVLLHISGFLDPVSQTLASQTCHALRAALGDSPAGTRLSYSQYLDYLTGLSRCNPRDEWVCEVCMAIHSIHRRDRPTSRWSPPRMSPLLCWVPWLPRTGWAVRKRRSDYNDNIFSLLLDRHYVEVSLKCARLWDFDYTKYHKKLVAFHHKRFFPHWADMLVRSDNVYQKLNPRIVETAYGTLRYLLMSSWFQRADPTSLKKLTYRDVAGIVVCPHQRVQQKRLKRRERCLLAKASEMAFKWRAQQLRGACFCCRTDYAVSVAADGMSFELHVWQDLGTEEFPMDPAWGGRRMKSPSRSWRKPPRHLLPDWYPPTPPPVHERSGSIRELYYRHSEIPMDRDDLSVG